MKKTTKLLGIVLALALLVGVFTAFGITASAAPATRVIDGKTYYEIGTAQDLLWFANEVNVNDNYTINGILTANIDLSGVCSETLGSWEPIDYFQGIFDGNGFEVTNLYCVGYESGGLFGQVYGGTPVIKNVTVRGYVSGTRYIGGIVGYLYTRTAQVLNCTNYATIESSYDGSNSIYIGGVVGYHTGALIQDSVNYGSVTVRPTESSANGYAGGITGQAITNSAIVNCANYGTISDGDANSNGWEYLGGIVGFTRGPITNCYNEGSVFQYGPKNDQEIGGIVGSIYDPSVVTGCFNNGPVGSDAARPNVGAVASEVYGTLSNCYWNDTATDAPGYAYKGSAATVTNVEGRSAASLADGATAYALGEGWGQRLGLDPVPVLGGMKVYYTIDPASLCTAPVYYYANSEGTHPTHDEQVPLSDYMNGFCIHCGGYQPATDTDGDGYLEIGNAGQLYWYAAYINAGNSASAELTAHIVDNEDLLDPSGDLNADPATLRHWTPIGTDANEYRNSTFEGNGYTISGLYSKGYGVGFIGFTMERAKIYNLGILDSYFENTGYATGAIAGAFHSYGLVMANCFSNATIAGNTYLAGGLVGTANSYPNITNCYYFGKTVGKPIFGTNFSLTNESSKNYYVYGGDDGRADTIQISAQMLASGELAYLLNGSVSGGTAWGQVLGTDAYPTPVATDANKVYYRLECDGSMVYSNSEKPAEHDHSVIDVASFDAQYTCLACGAQAVAEVDGAFYFVSLDAAIAYAYTAEGCTVTLIADAQFESSVIERGTFTLDLNGFSITPADGKIYLVYISEGHLTIQDSRGGGKVLKNARDYDTIGTCGGAITIMSGTFGTINVQNSNSRAYIYGGTFEHLYSPGGTVALYGGEYALVTGNGNFPEEFLATDHFYYDANGTLLDGRGVYRFENVSVRKGADLAHLEITYDNLFAYNGSPITPSVQDAHIYGKALDSAHYNVTYTNNIEVGTAYLTITAKGGTYTGEKVFAFTIEKATLTREHLTLVTPYHVYNREAKEIEVGLKQPYLGMGVYTFVYYRDGEVVSEMKDAGTYEVYIHAQEGSNFHATNDLFITTFTIHAQEVTSVHLQFSQDSTTYTGDAQEPTFTISVDGIVLVEGRDYTAEWLDDGFTNAGSYRLRVVAQGNYQGTFEKLFTIMPKPLDASTATVSESPKFNGSAQTPEVVVKDGDKVLALGVDYTLTWDNNTFVSAGVYTATIQGEGNYTATFTVTYTIEQATPVLTATTPSPSMMPGMRIQMSVQVVNAEHPTATDLPTSFFIYYQIGESGTPVKNSGLIFELPDGILLGETIYVWVENDPAGNANYTVGKSNVLELLVGQVDYSEEINAVADALAAAVADLTTKLESGDTTLANELAALSEALAQAKTALAEADAANKSELLTAITTAEQTLRTAIETVEQNLADAEAELGQAIRDGVIDLQGQITTLNQALTDAKTALELADEENKNMLLDKIGQANSALEAAVRKVTEDLATAKEELYNSIVAGETWLNNKIKDLTRALEVAENALVAADAANKAELTEKIDEASELLSAAIAAVEAKLEKAKADLDKAIADGDSDLDGKIAALNRALEAAKGTLEATASENKALLSVKIDEAYKTLDAAISTLQKDVDALTAQNEALTVKTESLEGFITFVCVLSSITFAGTIALAVFFFLKKRA